MSMESLGTIEIVPSRSAIDKVWLEEVKQREVDLKVARRDQKRI